MYFYHETWLRKVPGQSSLLFNVKQNAWTTAGERKRLWSSSARELLLLQHIPGPQIVWSVEETASLVGVKKESEPSLILPEV